jgi:tripartite-type tricarboxylate transporter receptor subunit TctC
MGELWQQSVIVDNRSLGQIYGLQLTARSPADGYTLLVTASSGYVNGVLTTKLPFSLKNDIEPIIQLTSQPYVLIVHPSLNVDSVSRLLALAKSKPGTLNYGSSGTGSAQHIGMELLKLMTNVDMVHIPYKGGGPAFPDLLAGRIQVYLGSPVSTMQFIKSKQLHAIAVTTEKRSKSFPDIPTISESGVAGFELESWYGVMAPKGISRGHVQSIFQTVNRVLTRADVQQKILAGGAEIPVTHSPDDFKQLVLREINKWEQFGRKTGIKVN